MILNRLLILDFEDYITQLCTYAYGKSTYPHLPSAKQVLLFIDQLKKSTK